MARRVRELKGKKEERKGGRKGGTERGREKEGSKEVKITDFLGIWGEEGESHLDRICGRIGMSRSRGTGQVQFYCVDFEGCTEVPALERTVCSVRDTGLRGEGQLHEKCSTSLIIVRATRCCFLPIECERTNVGQH